MSNAERQRKFRQNRDKDLQKREAYLASERKNINEINQEGRNVRLRIYQKEIEDSGEKMEKTKGRPKRTSETCSTMIENLVTLPMSPELPEIQRQAESRQKKPTAQENEQRAKFTGTIQYFNVNWKKQAGKSKCTRKD